MYQEEVIGEEFKFISLHAEKAEKSNKVIMQFRNAKTEQFQNYEELAKIVLDIINDGGRIQVIRTDSSGPEVIEHEWWYIDSDVISTPIFEERMRIFTLFKRLI